MLNKATDDIANLVCGNPTANADDDIEAALVLHHSGKFRRSKRDRSLAELRPRADVQRPEAEDADRMKIHDWPCEERPRERLLKQGTDALSNAELLGILLGSGVKGATAVDIARMLLEERGGLRGLARTSAAVLARHRGLGPARACRILAALELSRRSLATTLERGAPMSDPAAAGAYLSARLRDRPREIFACIYLDTRHQVLAFEELFAGTLDSADVHAREVVRQALAHNAAAVIFAHNHPSGSSQPSPSDVAVTRRLRDALQLVGVRVLDHLVVGEGTPQSMAAMGLM